MRTSFLLSLLLLLLLSLATLSTAQNSVVTTGLWCVAKNNAEDSALQSALDWACGDGGANCSPIQSGAPCYDASDIQNTASYAFNDYFLKNGMTDDSCNFDNTAALTSLNPSFGNCKMPSRDICNSDNLAQKMHDLFINNPFDASKFGKIFTLCWQIWQKRNDFVFRNKIFSPHVVVACAATYHCAIPNRINSSPNSTSSINFDDSVIQQTVNVGAGFILRDNAGCPLIVSARNLGKTIVPIAEATALRDSLLKAQEMAIQDLLVEGDSSLIINCVNEKFKCPWRLLQIIQDIKKIASSFHHIHFQYNFHEANFVANTLANLGHHCAKPSF
ncbi:hypothetical protein ACLB2K_063232 [Fragaria x ananassa]